MTTVNRGPPHQIGPQDRRTPSVLTTVPQNKDQYRRATQGCNVSSFFYAKIYSLLARRRSSQPVQRVYWPENVIDWPEQWRTACVMRYARGHKLQSFRRKLPFCMDHYSVTVQCLKKMFMIILCFSEYNRLWLI